MTDPIRADALAGLSHGFFTRQGGVSGGIYESLNGGQGSADRAEAVAENRRRAAEALGARGLVSVFQVHGSRAETVREPWPGPSPEADAMVSTTPGVGLAILVADCAPVLLADAAAGVVGAAHAGWKGALGGVLASVVGAMEAAGAARSRIRAAVGPCISQRAYEVGPEFVERFCDDDPAHARFFVQGTGDRALFDLPGFVLARLRGEGVEAEWTGHCTYSDEARFFSYRRATHRGEPDYGRLLAAIALPALGTYPMLHFSDTEFTERMARVRAAMQERAIDALLLFAPESHYWLTGYDTFGFCFFQCLVVHPKGTTLLTRSADLRQAQLTSNIGDIRIWRDRDRHDPTDDLVALLDDLGLSGGRIGWETRTQGLVHAHGAALGAKLTGLADASDLMGRLRLTKSPAELVYVRTAAELADAAWTAGLAETRAGAEEGRILAAMQGAVFAGGGDYPGNEFVIGSGPNALLCRYQAGRRRLDAQDQLTLEWAGTFRRYHAALMKTVVVGDPGPQHERMQAAAEDALAACEAALSPGRPMGDVFTAHAHVLDAHGLSEHRLNACGYSLGPRFSPSWMEDQMFYEGATTVMEPGMVFFLHMILMDSDSGCAMTLGRTSIVGADGAEPLSALPLGLVSV